jgi:hypothetical protein
MCAAWLVRWAPAPSSNCPPDRSRAEIQNYATGAVTIVAVRGGPLAVTPRLGRAPSVCATPPAITTSRRFARRRLSHRSHRGTAGDSERIHRKPEQDLHDCPAWTARVAASTVAVVSSRVLFLGFLAAVDYGQRGERYPRRVAPSRGSAKLPDRGASQCREGPAFMSSGEFSLIFWDVVLVARLVCRAVPSAWRESSQAWVWRWGQMCWVGTGGYGFLFTVTGCTLQAVYW